MLPPNPWRKQKPTQRLPKQYMGGAGVLLVHVESKSILLLQRAEWLKEPLTWAAPGGRAEIGESMIVTAQRELREETCLCFTLLELQTAEIIHTPPDNMFHTYVLPVSRRFEPILCVENVSWGWFALDALPKPLHFGVPYLLAAEVLKPLQV
jgi:8-oxo-dGTP pyrophosphatase MutT (NUDIX family)